MIETQLIQKAVAYYLKNGLSVFPLGANDKRPIASWEQYKSEFASQDHASQWGECNLAIATGKQSQVAVIDCESKDDAKWFFNNRGETPTVVQTRRGFHLYFRYPEDFEVRNAQRVPDEYGKPRYDIRGEGGYVVAPPSSVDGWTYQFVFNMGWFGHQELPVFERDWIPKRIENGYDRRGITDGLAYIKAIRAVSGQGGHDETWKAVNRLKDSGMSEAEALAAIAEWNHTNADPPWSMPELLHKVQDCYGSK